MKDPLAVYILINQKPVKVKCVTINKVQLSVQL